MDLATYMSTITDMRRRMSGVDRKLPYVCMEDFVLRNGRDFTNSPLPADVPKMEYRQCFMNATHLTLERPDLTYVEGYAFNIIPVLHAWCVDSEGRVIDPTWDYADTHQYYGVAFSREYLEKRMADPKKKYYGLIDDWRNNWPLLTGKHVDFRAKQVDADPVCARVEE